MLAQEDALSLQRRLCYKASVLVEAAVSVPATPTKTRFGVAELGRRQCSGRWRPQTVKKNRQVYPKTATA